jgi:lysophospholipase L1-like esterase
MFKSPNLLWRLMNGEMPKGLNPSVWWVGIGINDLSIKGCSEDVTLLGILRVVEEIQNKHPEGVVVINSILPVQRNQDGLLEHLGKHNKDVALSMKEQDMLAAQMDKKRDRYDFWPSIVSINKELAKFASKHKMIHFFNADKIFVDEREDGKYMRLDLFIDPVHPNLAGHKKLNTEIKAMLYEIIMDKS